MKNMNKRRTSLAYPEATKYNDWKNKGQKADKGGLTNGEEAEVPGHEDRSADEPDRAGPIAVITHDVSRPIRRRETRIAMAATWSTLTSSTRSSYRRDKS